ncbi:FAD-dependent oxidoreductase, partial [Citrobacter werkmanii]
VLESAPRLLARAVPPVFSQWLGQRAQDAGVDLHLEAVVGDLHADGHGVTAVPAGHGVLRADMVAVAAGLEPDVDLARRAGIAIHGTNHGICIDGLGATSAPHVFAAGDCASQFHPHLGAELRLESWQSANEQARIAAAAMVGASTPGLSAP